MVGCPRLNGHHGLSKLWESLFPGRTEKPGILQSMWSQSQTGLSDWTATIRRASGIPQAEATTSKMGTQPHPSANKQPKDLKTYWAHSYLKTHPFTWSFTSEEISPASPTRGQESVLPHLLKKSLDQPHSEEADTKQEELQSHSLQKRRPWTQIVKQNETTEKYCKWSYKIKLTRRTKWRGDSQLEKECTVMIVKMTQNLRKRMEA